MPPSPISEFTPSKNSIERGEGITLSWHLDPKAPPKELSLGWQRFSPVPLPSTATSFPIPAGLLQESTVFLLTAWSGAEVHRLVAGVQVRNANRTFQSLNILNSFTLTGTFSPKT
ncbi:hypothetical protein ACH41E_29680 [Streptomyces sp. NPDC020412]|uniref:hypothetical protein n=1 Tax=Streptomyces sp. NPDC020412 TaxID=3365073 RepID=UPI0037B6C0EA